VTHATRVLYGDADQYEQAPLPLTPDNDHEYAHYVASNVAPRFVEPEAIVVEAPDLLVEAEAILRSSRRRHLAGFALVALARKHGLTSSEAFQCAREFLNLKWSEARAALKATIPTVPVKTTKAPWTDDSYGKGLFPVSLGDWRGQARRKASNRRKLLRSIRHSLISSHPIRSCPLKAKRVPLLGISSIRSLGRSWCYVTVQVSTSS
jgi:hypothetical protein